MIPKVKGGFSKPWEPLGVAMCQPPTKLLLFDLLRVVMVREWWVARLKYFPHVHSTSELALPHVKGRGTVTTLSTLPLVIFVLTISRMQGLVGSLFSHRLLVSMVFHCEKGYVLSPAYEEDRFPFFIIRLCACVLPSRICGLHTCFSPAQD